jgi:hypothetical protein
MSIKEGIIDAKQQKDFRQTNDARIDSFIGNISRRRQQSVPENVAFGKANRPSTPINGIISNYYGVTAHQEIDEKYCLNAELVSSINNSHSIIYFLFSKQKLNCFNL